MTAHNPWVGAAFGRTSLDLARQISDAWEQELAVPDAESTAPTDRPSRPDRGARTTRTTAAGRRPQLRPVVTSSWQRSRRAGVDPEHAEPPKPTTAPDPLDRWAVHPLHPFTDVVESMLGSFAYDAGHIVVIADADGCLLWSMGHPKVLAASETIAFTPGHLWSEEAVGTNGVGTALAVDHPVQIFASEHYTRPVHPWVCSGAPVHDPASGEVLGVIDVSSGIRAAHPYSLAMVSATAKMVETLLANRQSLRLERLRARFFETVARRGGGQRALLDRSGRILAAHPQGWLHGPLVPAGPRHWLAPGGTLLAVEPFDESSWLASAEHGRHEGGVAPLRLRVLEDGRIAVAQAGGEVVLTRRRSQLLALLALSPEGIRGSELALALYGPGDHDVALRAEVSRLRRQLGGLIATHPYRLAAPVEADPAGLAGVATRLQR